MTRMYKHLLLIIPYILINLLNAQNYFSVKIPQRILLSLTKTPENSIAVTWRTLTKVENPEAQISVANNWTEFKESIIIYAAKEELIRLDSLNHVYHYSLVFTDLKPNTLYVYRVGGDSAWSEWNQFKTADNNDDTIQFLYFGDVQHDIHEYCSRLFRQAYKMVPNAAFWLSTGDLLDKAESDHQWEEFFSAAGFIPRLVPFILTAGNHEYENQYEDNIKVGERLTELWRSHIFQPVSTIDGLDETVFFTDYQHIRLIVLNGNEKLIEQAQWLESVLIDNPQKWTIISIHQPIYSMGKGRDKRKTREAFLPLINRFNIDLVLQGHDHVYSRTYKINDGKIAKNNDEGTVYVISNSGSDSYKTDSPFIDFAAKLGNEVQLFQVISVSSSSLNYKSYTVTGALYDQFELQK